MKDCEHLLEEIADRQKEILSILVFFKIVLIVVLCLAGVGFLISSAWWVFVFVTISNLVR